MPGGIYVGLLRINLLVYILQLPLSLFQFAGIYRNDSAKDKHQSHHNGYQTLILGHMQIGLLQQIILLNQLTPKSNVEKTVQRDICAQNTQYGPDHHQAGVNLQQQGAVGKHRHKRH